MNIGPLQIKWRKRRTGVSNIELRDDTGDPELNSLQMIETMAGGFRYIRERTDTQLLYFGRVFSVILFVEYKLSQILIKHCPDVEAKMLGEKIDIYKDFLKNLMHAQKNHCIDFGFEFDKLNMAKQALIELNKIRKDYAHSVNFAYLSRKSIAQILKFNMTEREDLYNSIPKTLPENDYVIGQLYIFGFCFSHATTGVIDAQK